MDREYARPLDVPAMAEEVIRLADDGRIPIDKIERCQFEKGEWDRQGSYLSL